MGSNPVFLAEYLFYIYFMNKVIRFRYVDSYQKISNILLYKKLKKTKFLKTILLCSLLFSFLKNYRNLLRLQTFIQKKYKKNRFKKILRKLFLQRLSKKISHSYDSLLSFISEEIHYSNSIQSISNSERLEKLHFFIVNTKKLKKILLLAKNLSIDFIASKILSLFITKNYSFSEKQSSLSKEIFFRSNYGVGNKFIDHFLKKNQIAINDLIPFLSTKLDLLLISHFPHIKSLQLNLSIPIHINGIALQRKDNFFLKTGDLIRIDVHNSNIFKTPFLYRKWFSLFYIINTLNPLYYNTAYNALKHIVVTAFTQLNSLSISNKKYLYNNILDTNNRLFSWNKKLIQEYLCNSTITNKHYFFESSISLTSTLSFESPKDSSSIMQLLKISLYFKENLKKSNLSLHSKWSFHDLTTYSVVPTDHSLTSYKFFSLLSVFYFRYTNLVSKFKTCNIKNIIYNIMVSINSNYLFYNKILFIYLLGPESVKSPSKITNKHTKYKYLNVFPLANKKNSYLLDIKTKHLFFYPIVSEYKGRNLKNSVLWNSFGSYRKKEHELIWTFFWNSNFNNLNSVGTISWYTKESICVFVYSLLYKQNRYYMSDNVVSNHELKKKFRY